ncbi:MAG: MFS transporter [Pirellulaceae bacterium]|nr:MFS transporter [Pirellulaceae bacterium]
MQSTGKFSVTTWLIITIASIGFLFDTYELLMTPLVAPPAIAELLNVPISNPLVTLWTGRLLWISALCGGVFGLWGGWLIDRLGRKTVMAASIFVYSFSPFLAAYSTTLAWFIFFRSTTFIGVCVEFIAAITWLAEVFEDKKQRERWLGITQAFASIGGVFVTLVSTWIGKNQSSLPDFGFPLQGSGSAPGTWRYVLATGLLPAIPIAILLPFVPESRIWKEKRAAGTLQRPKISALFAPEYLRLTIVTALLSACAYGIAFGALQLTPRLITPGLPEMAQASEELKPIRAEAKKLNEQFDKAETKEEKDAVRKQLGALAAKQKAPDSEIKEMGEKVQLYQEMGGLIGRIILAALIIFGISRVLLLKLFQVPALVMIPLTYMLLYHQGGSAFLLAYGVCGLLTVAQFSYFGEYLPKVFPMHLRGTGGSFATNVGGRMVGTSMAVVTSNLVAPILAGKSPVTPDIMAQSAGYVATGIAVIALLVGFFLPEPKAETMES